MVRCWLLGLLLPISGCQLLLPSVPVEQDGAPPGPPPRWFKAIIPQHEPLSRYGNPSSYSVRGQRYRVMHSARGYHARGLASWYGTKFHHKRTSSGEPYDMYALTAAHKTLPLPTYLRVKNLDNGRVTIVKVNDRGPFHSARILDLSYGSAVKLGLFPGGVAHVELDAIVIGAEPKTKKAPDNQSSSEHYYLQAGVFTQRASAANFRQQLSRFTTAVVSIEPTKQRYVVRIGPFATQQTANQLKNKLRVQGFRGVFSFKR